MCDDDWGGGDEYLEALAAVRNRLEDARACLNRPERSPAEAINHIESALKVIAEFV